MIYLCDYVHTNVRCGLYITKESKTDSIYNLIQVLCTENLIYSVHLKKIY